MSYVLGLVAGFVAAVLVVMICEALRERRPRPRRLCGAVLSANGFTISRNVDHVGADGVGDPVRCTRNERHEPPCCAVVGQREIW